jgi:peptidylprolyl isomerase
VRRRLAALVLVPALMVTAAACGDDKGDSKSKSSPSPSPSSTAKTVDVSPTGQVTAGKAIGTAPDIKVPAGEPPKELKTEVLTEGTGPVVNIVDLANVNYEGVAWKTRKIFDSSFERGQPTEFPLTGVVDGWGQGIAGKKIGSRLLITIPPELGYGEKGSGEDIGPNETLVFVVDVLGVKPGVAKGEPTKNIPAELPKVKLDGDKPTGITVPAGAKPPAQPVVQNLIDGAGAEVKAGDGVYAQYATYLWDGAKQLSNTHYPASPAEKKPLGVQPMQEGQTMAGLMDAVKGKKVGSRLLVVLPPDKGFGAEGKPEAGIPPNATTVWVIDVIDAQAAGAGQ